MGLVRSATDIRYAYTPDDLITASVPIGYSYEADTQETRAPVYVGHKAATTQSVVNNLPPWMKMRNQEETTGWCVTNSYCQSLDHEVQILQDELAELFLATTDVNQLEHVYSVNLSFDPDDAESRNLLRNPAFTFAGPTISGLPLGWTGTGSLTRNDAILGTFAVRMKPGEKLSQTVYLQNLAVQKLIGSLYFKGTGQIRLLVSAEDLHGNLYSEEVPLPAGAVWNRISVELPVNKQVYRAQFTVKSVTGVVTIGAPQLESSLELTPWSLSRTQELSYLRQDKALGVIQAIPKSEPRSLIEESRDVTMDSTLILWDTTNDYFGLLSEGLAQLISCRVNVIPVANRNTFINIQIPTRIEPLIHDIQDLEPFGTQVSGRRVSPMKEVFPVKWVPSQGKILEQSADNRFDVFQEYSVRDVYISDDGVFESRDMYPVTVHATTTRQGYIFAICSQDKDTNTYYSVKVIPAKRPPVDRGYLESVEDFKIELPSETIYGADQVNETITSVGFSQADPRWFVVNTSTGRRILYRMYFDYCYLDRNNRKLYFREDYAFEGGSVKIL